MWSLGQEGMVAVLKTRWTEFNPFCKEDNVERKNQLRSTKQGDPETGCSVGSMKRGKRKEGKSLENKGSQSAAARQKEEKRSALPLLFCTAAVRAWRTCASAQGEDHSSAECDYTATHYKEQFPQEREKNAHQNGLATAVLIIFLMGFFLAL